jgi:hypothetical protein
VIKKIAIITIFSFIFALNAYGFQFPSAGPDDEGLQEWMEKVTESDIESSRVEKPTRKASEDKSFMYGDDLAEIENTYYPPFDQSPWNWDVPDWWIDWPDFPPWPDYDIPPWYVWNVDPDRPPAWSVLSCPTQNCPGVVYCEDEYFEWTDIAGTGQIISNVEVTSDLGGLVDFAWDNTKIGVWISTEAEDLDVIHIRFEKNFLSEPGPPAVCEKDVIIRCEVCDCDTADPFSIDKTSTPDTIAEGGAGIDVYVEGGCPPFSWSVSANGWSFQNATTTARVNKLTVTDLGDCPADWCVEAKITVTDACGDSDSYYIRESSKGNWETCYSSGAGCAGNCGAGTCTAVANIWGVENLSQWFDLWCCSVNTFVSNSHTVQQANCQPAIETCDWSGVPSTITNTDMGCGLNKISLVRFRYWSCQAGE